MIRERVDIRGHVRPMEPKSDIPILQMRASEIGIIKEKPVRRWADGQNAADKKYRRAAEKVIKKRKKLEARAEKMLADAREQGLLLEGDSIHTKEELEAKRKSAKRADSDSESTFSTVSRRIDIDRRWGPLDLKNERPPPTAIAARRDTVCFIVMNPYLVLIACSAFFRQIAGGVGFAEEEHIPLGAEDSHNDSQGEHDAERPRRI